MKGEIAVNQSGHEYPISRQMFVEASNYLAGGISSQFRAASPHPPFYERAKGAYLWDVDGNRYIDFCLGQGPNLLGHAPTAVLERVREEMELGILFAGQHRLEIELGRQVCRHIPCAERVRFGSTGSEVVQAALRLARAVTGREKFIKFEGQYHGWFDNVAISVKGEIDELGPRENANPLPWSRGMSQSVLQECITLPWNDLALLEQVVQARRDEIAAIIMEPMMCNSSCIVPQPGYLEGVRELCDREGIVLIFDEIITGFRLGLGGASAEFGVTPDLATFGKAMASGFPISLLAGKERFMRHIASGEVLHAGTYNTNTVVTAAAIATIKELERYGEEGYRKLAARGERLAQGLMQAARETGWDVLVQSKGPVCHMGFTDRTIVKDYRDSLAYDTALFARFAQGLYRKGVRVIGRGIWYTSFAHTDDDIDQALAAAKEVLLEMKAEAGRD